MNDQKEITQEEIDDKTFPATEYTKKIYTFSNEELDEIKPLADVINLAQTYITMAQLSTKVIDNIVGFKVLKRIGVKTSPDSKCHYNLPEKKIIYYEPKNWCLSCKNRKAEFKYQEKLYCKICIEAVKKEIAKPIEAKKD